MKVFLYGHGSHLGNVTGTFEQIFIPTSHEGSIRNLALNCLVFLVEKKFENAPCRNKRDQI